MAQLLGGETQQATSQSVGGLQSVGQMQTPVSQMPMQPVPGSERQQVTPAATPPAPQGGGLMDSMKAEYGEFKEMSTLDKFRYVGKGLGGMTEGMGQVGVAGGQAAAAPPPPGGSPAIQPQADPYANNRVDPLMEMYLRGTL